MRLNRQAEKPAHLGRPEGRSRYRITHCQSVNQLGEPEILFEDVLVELENQLPAQMSCQSEVTLALQ
jgi:hypothetical protein